MPVGSGLPSVVAKQVKEHAQECGLPVRACANAEEQHLLAHIAGQRVADRTLEEPYELGVPVHDLVEKSDPRRAGCVRVVWHRQELGQQIVPPVFAEMARRISRAMRLPSPSIAADVNWRDTAQRRIQGRPAWKAPVCLPRASFCLSEAPVCLSEAPACLSKAPVCLSSESICLSAESRCRSTNSDCLDRPQRVRVGRRIWAGQLSATHFCYTVVRALAQSVARCRLRLQFGGLRRRNVGKCHSGRSARHAAPLAAALGSTSRRRKLPRSSHAPTEHRRQARSQGLRSQRPAGGRGGLCQNRQRLAGGAEQLGSGG